MTLDRVERLTDERLAEIREVVAEGGNILVEDVRLLLREVDALKQERDGWLAWSGGDYPDTSPGDVIYAEVDGTVILDDGITTWNPLRALIWRDARRIEDAESMLARVEAAEDALVSGRVRTGDDGYAAPSECATCYPPKVVHLTAEEAMTVRGYLRHLEACPCWHRSPPPKACNCGAMAATDLLSVAPSEPGVRLTAAEAEQIVFALRMGRSFTAEEPLTATPSHGLHVIDRALALLAGPSELKGAALRDDEDRRQGETAT